MSKPKPTENPYRPWGADSKVWEAWPKRPGETTRRCERCGADFEPHSRNQRFCCVECRKGGA